MSLPLNIFKNKNVLVTGHTGFKGSWLSIWLRQLGANVIGYALDPVNQEDNFSRAGLKDNMVDIRGDIRDSSLLNKVFKKYNPEIVFHLAAQPLVRYSYEHPKYTYEVNVIGTLNLLEAVKSCKATKAAIIITSDKCYENQEWIWGYRENDPMGGYDPYSSSKGCVELLVSSYRNSFFNPKEYVKHNKVIASVRAGNVIGGGDWSKDRIIPDCINALKDNREIVLRNPKAVRPWQHVLEPLGGYLMLGAEILRNNTKFSGAWNFGPMEESIVSVEEITAKVIKYWGTGSYKALKSSSDFHEANLLNLDISKAKFNLNWKPRWNVDKAVEKTVEWYKNYNSTDVYKLCVNQINEYCSK
ncbi:CDP-glucose 4,6-dehydratase [Clostridium pasteurianum DSM 525 = ATCC 6013]|uniref:CDP-glucose 4,6-dehydratase n=2 Tax=Clostridium pasteurianum TaxID=1501 RepID=A0A0H3J0K8_CLOPA|nr:CDP-glucose 4,6-dehydratase [Clostridium pasteurianum]AJA46879.1 CDP-glucose 4,6-dehydratase [Clostridium pasteurianum DSM 525 = ATCC 6013]AJA50867.1 CDP-glucose 4,6-dehydratase [Clostridium pasteurianum DSM 525 = ATCC 6013]AOZ74263.1 CDP-glucose 4,6-dehydratase [Clostridium pasteurianum DSM 525 = ATCC 6013]AOZ78062.1 CDP-glucose 4,6-dehydratase [Clostridium pasteurianum]ELP58128.1 CDP-glucose 4,6-dehydratase [Clostridium pasteurianum DSM 525 = ATCC 6013]